MRVGCVVVITAVALGMGMMARACEALQVAIDVPTALVFSGGGAKGAYEAGVAASLIKGGVPVHVVSGSSAGALNAVMIADGRLDRLEALWRALTREQVYVLRPAVIFGGLLPGWGMLLALDRVGSVLDPEPLRQLIAATVDLDRLRASAVRLVVVATDLRRRRARVFDNTTVSLDALMAATAIPGAFRPVELDGDVLADGGLVARAPVLQALAAGVALRRAVIVQSYATGDVRGRPDTLRRTLEEAFETAMVHQIERDTELARLRHPDVDISVITPSAPLDVRPLDFDPGALARAFDLGRADGRAWLRAHLTPTSRSN